MSTFWRRKRRHVPIDMSASDEATAAKKRAEARWPRVQYERRKSDDVLAHAVRVLEENHFTQKARHALEGHS